MADLDDFFAKKDRKKSKSTKKFTTTEEVAKKLEDNAKKTDKNKKERVLEGDDGAAPSHEQDEWKEFEEEKKDYTGLKIGNLTISQNADGTAGSTDSNLEQQQGFDEGGNESDKKVGPWKRIGVEPPKEIEIVERKAPEPTPTAPPTSNTYVPPSLRNLPAQQPLQPTRLKSKAAPDIHSEEFFPTLSGGKSQEPRRGKNEGSFEMVASNKSTSHRQAEQTRIASGQGPKLNLGNRYNTLSNDS